MKALTRTLKKKVLHIGQDTGGVRTYLGSVFNYCNRNEFEFVVLVPANELFRAYCNENNVKYYPVNILRGGNPLIMINSLLTIIKVILKEQPDIIHTHSAKGGLLGRLAAVLTGSKNIIYTPHAFSYLSFTGYKRIIFYALEIMARGWTSILLAISYSEAQKAIFELGYKKENVKIILNSIPVPNEITNKPSDMPLKIRMIGRLTVQKNPLLFLEIAKVITDKYENIEFSILGAGIHDHLATEINDYLFNNSLIDKVKIESWGDDQKSLKYLQEAHIYVMTSIFEGLPYSLLEAMSLGKACVVSNVEGNKDVIHNYENGFTCTNKDDFCEKIELLINNEKLRNDLGAAAFRYVKLNHNIVENIVLLENIYRKLGKFPVKSGSIAPDENVIPFQFAD